MANIYSQVSKINNANGRSNYIKDPKRQEAILLQKSNLEYGWDFISDFEKNKSDSDKNNWEAREIIVALPNKLSKNLEKLEAVSDDLVEATLGVNREYEYAVHWNANRTNLHIHILFSERERVNELKPKKYKRDMWYDPKTNRMAKAHAEGAELRYKKGDIMKDKNGNTRYESDPFTAKDPYFKSQAFLTDHKFDIQSVFEKHDFELGVQTYDTPFLSQRKEHKGASSEYLTNVKSYNREVRAYNEQVATHLQLDPDQEKTYKDIRHNLEGNIRYENKQAKTWSQKASEVVREMREFVTELVIEIRGKAKALIDNSKLANWWDKNKEEFIENFQEKEALEFENKRLDNYIDTADKIIEDQREVIQEIERSYDYEPEL